MTIFLVENSQIKKWKRNKTRPQENETKKGEGTESAKDTVTAEWTQGLAVN